VVGLVCMMYVTMRAVQHVGNLLGGNNGPPKKPLHSQIPCQAVNQATQQYNTHYCRDCQLIGFAEWG
jgi:hypothetical protein